MNMAFPAIPVPDRYDAVLAALVPIAEPEALTKLRKRMMTARDLATRGLCNANAHSDGALSLFHVIVDVVSTYVFRFQDLGNLEHAANLCLKLLRDAADLDQLGGFNAQSH